jgi:hypothetical protein
MFVAQIYVTTVVWFRPYFSVDLFTGDVFQTLKYDVGQGWSEGGKDGRVGLYPTEYVELVKR